MNDCTIIINTEEDIHEKICMMLDDNDITEYDLYIDTLSAVCVITFDSAQTKETAATILEVI